MCFKKLIIILLILLFISFCFFVFYRQDKVSVEIEDEGFDQIYVLEIPPKSRYLAGGWSEKFYEAFKSEGGIIVQKQENILPSLLQLFDVQYVLLRDKEYWDLFEPFLDYSSGEEKEDLPRTFRVKKDALTALNEPLLILGDGWYGLEKDEYQDGFRWFAKEATILYVIPTGKLNQANDILSFLIRAHQFSDKGKIEITLNKKMIYSSSAYEWVTVRLDGLEEGINQIKIRSSRGCVVTENDAPCFSYLIGNMELFDIKNISSRGLLRLDRFIEKEKEYWLGEHAALRIFSSTLRPSFISFQIQTIDDEVRMINVIEKDKEIERIILFSEEPQKIGLLTYQQGENIFYLAADGCEKKTIEGQEVCITAKVKDLKIELLE